MYGDDWKYAASRLDGTIVTHEGHAVYVEQVGQKMIAKIIGVRALEVGGEDYRRVKVNDLDLTPVKLGFCNFDNRVNYLARMPMRRDWRQGLRRGNFVSMCGHVAERIPYTKLADVIEGIYPTFEEVVKQLKVNHSMAWCREWGLLGTKGDAMLLYKNDVTVGRWSKKEGPILDAQYIHLRESLEEAL